MHDNCFSSRFDLGTYSLDKFSFCKKKAVGLCFTDGNKWPLENAEAGQT